MNLREAAQQALEVLTTYNADDSVFKGEFDQEITALRTALAEPEQEFVCSTGLCRYRKPLTDEEIDALPLPPSGTATVRDIVRLIERAHGIGGEA